MKEYTIFYKGIEKDPTIFGLNVDFIIPYFFTIIGLAILTGFIGLTISVTVSLLFGVMSIIGLVIGYKVLKRVTQKKNRIFKKSTKRKIQINLYSKELIKNNI